MSNEGIPLIEVRTARRHVRLSFDERNEWVLFVSERTLLCFLATCLTRDRIRPLDDVFRDGFFLLLLDAGFRPD